MPELPEVETIRRYLEPRVIGKTIARVRISLPRLLSGAGPGKLVKTLPGQRIIAVKRRAKYLVFELSADALVFHMGMTGQLMYAGQKTGGGGRGKDHIHLRMGFTGGGGVLFRDPRTFGKVLFMAGGDWNAHGRLMKLGPEPLEIRITPFLRKRFPVQSSRSIKSLLLDQTFLCGVGNIYCDESLFISGIHPEEQVRSISLDRWRVLLNAVKKTLRKGIKNYGTTFSDYRKPDGNAGANREKLLVYGRGGQPCVRCGESLVKTAVAQRGTVFCPVCQSPPH